MTATDSIGLVDHHCHGVVQRDLTADEFRGYATESDWPAPPGTDALDSPFGLALRRFCAPLLDVDPDAGTEAYLRRRAELGWQDVTGRLLAAARVGTYVIETGFPAASIAAPPDMAELTGRPAERVVRLEAIAERIAPATTAASFRADFEAELHREHAGAVGVKTVAAYRFGLDLAAVPPDDAELVRAVDRWLSQAGRTGRHRLTDPTVISAIVWSAVELGTVLQVHVGFGDSDVQLDRADPSRLTPFLRATRQSGLRVALLHCYPFVREAGILAHVFPHVVFDVSCLSHYAGPSAGRLLRQAVEVAPFGKLLYASDAYALPEHYLVSAVQWRRDLAGLLDEWIGGGWITAAEADRLAWLVGTGNAERVYGLGTGERR